MFQRYKLTQFSSSKISYKTPMLIANTLMLKFKGEGLLLYIKFLLCIPFKLFENPKKITVFFGLPSLMITIHQFLIGHLLASYNDKTPIATDQDKDP